MQLPHTTVYKNISLLVKTAIVVITLFYIYRKLLVKNDFSQLLQLVNRQGFNNYMLAASGLMLVNWLFEAIKWRLLIRSLEPISLAKSCKAILAGLSICIFTPNRIGEFAGRIYYLEQADKIKSALLTFVGSFYQLFCTIVIGLFALLLWYYRGEGFPWLKLERLLYWSAIILVSIVLFVLLYRLLLKNSVKLPLKVKHYITVFKTLQGRTHFIVLLLSLGRYFIFSLQFYLLLKGLGVDIALSQAVLLIPITFFLIAVIPTFALSELGVRGATAIYILGTVALNTTGILAASLILWVINLALPALVGLLFVVDLKFFKADK